MRRSRRIWLSACTVLVVWPWVVRAQDFVPGGIDAAGLDRIVPDRIVHDHGGMDALGNWEPFTSVLGTSTFLIESNTFALQPGMQRYGLMFQPVDGGEPAPGEVFFTDDGEPYLGAINNYRQNGNPGRVAGDRRPGATAFIAGGEASPNEFSVFWSDDRWDLGLTRAGRYAAVYVLGYLFQGNPPRTCIEAADTNDSSNVDLLDAIFLLSHLFTGGPVPPDPWVECDVDPTPDDLTCESYPPCE